jgi:hypothetical protein
MFVIEIQFFGINPFIWRFEKIIITKLLIKIDITVYYIGINIASYAFNDK